MKYYYLNRIAMAVLVALLLFFGTRTFINIAFEEHEEEPGYEVAGEEEKPGGKDEKPDEGGSEIIAALHEADAAQGEADAGLCKVCHTFEKGGATLVGPNLYNTVGMKIASHEGFNYTPALKAKEGDWTFENLDVWLENPQAFAPGTTMAFPGIHDLKKRANVIEYLRKNADNPVPVPEVEEKPGAEEPDEGEEEAPAGEEEEQSEILVLLVSADPAKGEADAALCKVCHTFDKGGATLVGPNLYGVVGNDIAAHEDFTYTPALKGKEGDWTYENLDVWLANPQAFAPGTTMAFPGIPDAKKRADMIAFLRSKHDNPPPLPEAGAPAEEEPADEEGPAAEEPADEEPVAEEEPAGEPETPAMEEPADEAPAMEEPAAEEPAPAEEEEPAAEEPAADEPTMEAEEPAPVDEEPAVEEVEEEAMEETIVNPPTVSEDAPSEPSMGEPPSPSQPQPVYPDEADTMGAQDDMGAPDEMGAPDAMDAAEETMGEPPSSSQPQPVYPDGEPAMDDAGSTGSVTPSDDGMRSSQPQPVYPDGPPQGL